MFTLWYTILSYKEYRDVLFERFTQKACPLPQKQEACSRNTGDARTTIKIQQQQQKLEPVKAPRSPSPHPLRTEAFDDNIDYDEEESEEEEEEEEEQNSVIDSFRQKQHPVNDFINVEIDKQRRDFHSQRYRFAE